MRSKLVKGALIALAGLVLFWIGGFLLLTKGAEWPAIEAAAVGDSSVKAAVGGNVKSVKPEFLGYRYRFAGQSGRAEFTARVDGSGGSKKMNLVLVESQGRWSVARANEVSE